MSDVYQWLLRYATDLQQDFCLLYKFEYEALIEVLEWYLANRSDEHDTVVQAIHAACLKYKDSDKDMWLGNDYQVIADILTEYLSERNDACIPL